MYQSYEIISYLTELNMKLSMPNKHLIFESHRENSHNIHLQKLVYLKDSNAASHFVNSDTDIICTEQNRHFVSACSAEKCE